jgi:hypothetical protein
MKMNAGKITNEYFSNFDRILKNFSENPGMEKGTSTMKKNIGR